MAVGPRQLNNPHYKSRNQPNTLTFEQIVALFEQHIDRELENGWQKKYRYKKGQSEYPVIVFLPKKPHPSVQAELIRRYSQPQHGWRSMKFTNMPGEGPSGWSFDLYF